MESNDIFNKSNCSLGGEKLCYQAADLMFGAVHLIMGLIGFIVNILALYLFYKMGKQKPYYIVIVFETFTDLVVCLTALYSAFFLMLGREDISDELRPLCDTAGMLWNWNMVITPLLLSVAGLMRLHGVYWPHSAFLELHRRWVIGLCVLAYIYGVIYACFPYFFEDFGYKFKNMWSVCDFELDPDSTRDTIGAVYFALMGPIPVFISLLLIFVTNTIIVLYLLKRYQSSWEREKTRKKSRKQGSFGSFIVNMDQKVQSKQVVVSLLLMTGWYMVCYSLIIFCNFKNFVTYWKQGDKIDNPDVDMGMSKVSTTYFYAMYNFVAYLNSFVNPFILLTTGSSFRQELGRLSLRLRNKCGLLSVKTSRSSSLADRLTDHDLHHDIQHQKKASLPLIPEQRESTVTAPVG
ncbi:hypothetical protein ACHWQZ_G005115 [Mnemiopsis leidyi]